LESGKVASCELEHAQSRASSEGRSERHVISTATAPAVSGPPAVGAHGAVHANVYDSVYGSLSSLEAS